MYKVRIDGTNNRFCDLNVKLECWTNCPKRKLNKTIRIQNLILAILCSFSFGLCSFFIWLQLFIFFAMCPTQLRCDWPEIWFPRSSALYFFVRFEIPEVTLFLFRQFRQQFSLCFPCSCRVCNGIYRIKPFKVYASLSTMTSRHQAGCPCLLRLVSVSVSIHTCLHLMAVSCTAVFIWLPAIMSLPSIRVFFYHCGSWRWY